MTQVVDAERAWEQRKDWTNPFGESSKSQSEKKKRRKKKKKGSRKRYTDEEISQTETLLDELLSYEDEDSRPSKKMDPVDEELGDDEKGVNPFDEPEEKEDYGNEYDKQGFNSLLNKSPAGSKGIDKNRPKSRERKTTPSAPANPFGEEESMQEHPNPFGKKEDEVEQDDEHHEQTVPAASNTNPFGEESEDAEEEYEDSNRAVDDLDEDSSLDSYHVNDSREGNNPFDDESEYGNESEADDESSVKADEESIDPPSEELLIRAKSRISSSRPSSPKKKHARKEQEETEKTISDSFDSAEQIEAVKTDKGVETRFVLVKKTNSYEGMVPPSPTKDPAQEEDLKRNSTDETSEGSASDDESDTSSEDEEEAEQSEEDVVESSKRLLRMVDQRMEYQKHNDEIKKLKSQIETMKIQAEAMSEQLRRAVETKCDLVLAQTELERCHEQDLICKDDEMKDMKRYVQEIMEKGAMNELNFMNEIATLSKTIQDMKERHRNELREKDFIIAQYQMRMHKMKTESVRGESRTSFKSRFLEKIEEENSENGSVASGGSSVASGGAPPAVPPPVAFPRGSASAPTTPTPPPTPNPRGAMISTPPTPKSRPAVQPEPTSRSTPLPEKLETNQQPSYAHSFLKGIGIDTTFIKV